MEQGSELAKIQKAYQKKEVPSVTADEGIFRQNGKKWNRN